MPCVQLTFEREIRRVHALPRAPARAGGAASRPRRARAHRERRCGAHTDAREQPSASQQLAPSEHRSRRIRRDPRDPRVGPRGSAAPHATPAESAGATERLLRPPGLVIIGPLDGAADHGPRCHMDQDDDHAARRRCGARNHAPPAGVHALSLPQETARGRGGRNINLIINCFNKRPAKINKDRSTDRSVPAETGGRTGSSEPRPVKKTGAPETLRPSLYRSRVAESVRARDDVG